MATSAFFSVALPTSTTDDQLVRIYEWGKSNCLQCNIIQDGGVYTIILERNDERDLRSRQRLMLTNLKNWGIDTSKLQKGWVKLLTETEYERITHKDVPTDFISEGSASPSDSETCGVPSPAEPTLELKYPTMLSRIYRAEDQPLFKLKPPKNILRSARTVKAI